MESSNLQLLFCHALQCPSENANWEDWLPFARLGKQKSMKRDIDQLKAQKFDVLIVGGGSHGACAARDAALRGLSVAMVDQGDICGATSHNSLKTIHGGIRYLQHLNFKRTLESIKEQKIWLRTAPHLVRPLPFLMPTYGHGIRGPLAMLAGITLFRIFGLGRNKHLREDRRLPPGRLMSSSECLKIAPNIKQNNLTGGAIWYDAQVQHADRAVMQISQHASELGAAICNYVQVNRLQIDNDRVIGVDATDQISGEQFTIQAKTVLNAAGPWASQILRHTSKLKTNTALVKSMNLVTTLPAPKAAVAVQSKLSSDSVVGSTKRLYFIVPWLGRAVIGTTHFAFEGEPDQLTIESDEILSFIDEINLAYPSLNLKPTDVLYCYQGLAPAGEKLNNNEENTLRLHESKVMDHAQTHQVDGIVSIFSIKWTTARLVAEQAVNLIAKKLGNNSPSKTHEEPLNDNLALPFVTSKLDHAGLKQFCKAHIEHSMTVNLVDLLLRRTNDTVLGTLSLDQIIVLANTMQNHFNWDQDQKNHQLDLLLANWLPNKLTEQLKQTSIWAS